MGAIFNCSRIFSKSFRQANPCKATARESEQPVSARSGGQCSCGGSPLAVRVGFSLHRLAAWLALRALLFFLQIPGCLRAWFGSLGLEL